MKVECVLINPNAVLPYRATAGSAGFDLISVDECEVTPSFRKLISTGIALKMPSFMYGRIAPRSGLSFRSCLDIGAGVIDSDYTGEIKVLLINNGVSSYKVNVGDKIAQIIFERCYYPKIHQVISIDETDRSDRGFGSTGHSVVK